MLYINNRINILYPIAMFLLIFLTGFWLSRGGRPYGVLLLTVHKLVSVGAVVFLAIVLVRINRAVGLNTIEVLAAVITGGLFLGTIATGGLLSAAKPIPAMVHLLHKTMPFLTLLATGATLFLAFRRK